MASPVDTPFTAVSVECPRCHTKQIVHVAVREGRAKLEVSGYRVQGAEGSSINGYGQDCRRAVSKLGASERRKRTA